jgi:hypothetical protein
LAAAWFLLRHEAGSAPTHPSPRVDEDDVPKPPLTTCDDTECVRDTPPTADDVPETVAEMALQPGGPAAAVGTAACTISNDDDSVGAPLPVGDKHASFDDGPSLSNVRDDEDTKTGTGAEAVDAEAGVGHVTSVADSL